MKKTQQNEEPEMRAEYDFSGGVRGKYAGRLGGGRNVVVLELDVAAVFRDSEAVNRALRTLISKPPWGSPPENE